MKNIKTFFSSSVFLTLLIIILVIVLVIFLYEREPLDNKDKNLLPAFVGRVLNASPSHILVKFKSGISVEKHNQIKVKYNVKEDSEIKNIGVKIISTPPGRTPEEFVDILNKNEGNSIEFAEPDFVVEPSLIPNDPWFVNWQKDKEQINIIPAWDTTTGGVDVILAIVDTGVNCAHEDLVGQCVSGWNFYDKNDNTSDVTGHGTSVAGVAAATGNNSIGIAGNAWQSKIMPLRVSAQNGTATYGAIASAITYAADKNVKVVNASYQINGSRTIQSAASYLKNRGGLLMASEGNYGSKTGYNNHPDIISVSAVDLNDVKYSWSSYGGDVDVSAPGCTGATTISSGGYGSFCGTSNSAPEVAGLLALMWSANSLLTPDQMKEILFLAVEDLGTPGWDQYYGWGRIDAGVAVDMADQYVPNPNPTTGKAKNTPKSR